jgi:Hint domain
MGAITPAGLADVVQTGSLVVELTCPVDGGSVLLDHRADAGWPRGFSIFHDAQAGLVILHRQGAAVARHILPGPLPRDWALARLTFAWDGPARHWSLRLEDVQGAWSREARGTNPLPLAGPDLLALCAGGQGSRRDASVQWFGVALTTPSPQSATWIGHRTPVETLRGRVAAGDLRIGDQLLTLDHGPRPLRAMHHGQMPNRGRFAPVLLRAPYFARQTDLLVAQGQLTLLSGVAVEYLFGEDAVLAPAFALRDGNSALSDARRPITTGISLDLGAPHVILADGCPLLINLDCTKAALPYRLLHDYETTTLQSLLGRGGQRSAA